MEKIVGDPVFAATVVLTGKFYTTVAEAGSATAVARIEQIIVWISLYLARIMPVAQRAGTVVQRHHYHR